MLRDDPEGNEHVPPVIDVGVPDAPETVVVATIREPTSSFAMQLRSEVCHWCASHGQEDLLLTEFIFLFCWKLVRCTRSQQYTP